MDPLTSLAKVIGVTARIVAAISLGAPHAQSFRPAHNGWLARDRSDRAALRQELRRSLRQSPSRGYSSFLLVSFSTGIDASGSPLGVFRNIMPGSSPFVNSMPADSRTAQTAAMLLISPTASPNFASIRIKAGVEILAL